MANTVFFAWQADTQTGNNKTFIWDAIEEAAKHCTILGQPELSPRPEVDTKGVPGTPNIVETIFRRIGECSVFIADLTFIGSSSNGRKMSNPNVLLELGFAAKSIGWDRTILVMNGAFGQADELPFDILQHRWPMEYRLTEQTQVRERRFDSLAKGIEVALRDCANHILLRANEMASELDTGCLDFVARHESAQHIDMPLPGKTMGQQLISIEFNLVVRRLMDLGALTVVDHPHIGYAWTHDGRRMIDEVNRLHPKVLRVLRQHQQT